jgi:hypothetical protein
LKYGRNNVFIRNAALFFVGLFILLPTTLVTVVFAPMGVVYALAMLIEHQFEKASILCVVITCGSAGVISMWILFIHFKNQSEKSPPSLVHCIALLCGSAVSIWFVIYSGGTLMFRLLFFGWPLLGALYFLRRIVFFKSRLG